MTFFFISPGACAKLLGVHVGVLVGALAHFVLVFVP
jgi:hypothetical protein